MTTTTEEPQALRALALANEVRLKRAQLKRELAAGEVEAASVIEDLPEWAEGMRLGEFLRARRWTGPKTVARFCRSHQLNPTRTLGHLTLRQKALIAESLR